MISVQNTLLVLAAVPMLFLIVVIFHYRHLKYLLLIWTEEYLKHGKILTKESSVTYFESINTIGLVFRFLKTEKKYPEIRANKALMKKLQEYRLTRNITFIGIIIYVLSALIAINFT